MGVNFNTTNNPSWYRRHSVYGQIKRNLVSLFRKLAKHKQCLIEKVHMCSDHVHMLISIPPKYSISQVIGYIKGKSAIYIVRNYFGRTRNYNGQKFWARGYLVSTVGRDETIIREYIKNQEEIDKKEDDAQQGKLFI